MGHDPGVWADASLLAVDDEPVNLVLLERILRRAGYRRLRMLVDPRDVLGAIEEEEPDLVFLDLRMPHLDGFAIMEQVRAALLADTYLPILVLTADASPETKRLALAQGGTDFLTKPFDATEVVLRAGNLLHARRLHLELRRYSEGLEDAVRRRTEELERFHVVLDSMRDPVVIQDPETGRALYANRAMRNLVGRAAEPADDDDVATWPDEDVPAVRAAAAPIITGRIDATVAEVELHGSDGRTLPLQIQLQRIADGGRDLLVAVGRDLSELRRAENALRAALEHERDAALRLRAIDAMKNTFLSAVSHELRTPLTTVLGVGLTLENRMHDLPVDLVRHLLQRLRANAERLERLLRDLLDLNRLTRGELEPRTEEVDAAAVVRAVAHATVEEGRELDLDLQPVSARLDAVSFERIVENLVVNAIRYTPPGSPIHVRVASEVGPKGDDLLVVVEDEGSGVPDEFKEAIFEPFRQGPQRIEHSPGTGVGLALVAAFARMHGGVAWVEDRVGGGASFRVRLPRLGPSRPSDGLAPASQDTAP